MTRLPEELAACPKGHGCSNPRELRTLLKRLLGVAENADEFLARVQAEPSIGSCLLCQNELGRLANAIADEDRDRCVTRFAASTVDEVCSLVAQTRPRVWPPVPRWPEVEAIVEARRAGRRTKFFEVVRNLGLMGVRYPEGVQPFDFLRNYLLNAATPSELAAAGVIAGDHRLQARAYREQSLLESVDAGRDLWAEAAEFLEPSDNDESPATQGPLSGRRRRVTPKRALRLADVVDDAVAKLDQLEAVASQLCADATQRGYAYSAVNLIRIQDSTIEAVAGTGDAAKWVGRVRHPIHPQLHYFQRQDIQCAIVLSEQAELVMPDDPRLDPFVKAHFQHVLPRLFVPLVVVYAANGAMINKACRWEAVSDAPTPTLKLVSPPGSMPRVFGTTEVAMDHLEFGLADFLEFASFATRRAPELYRCTLAHVLDRIVLVMRRMLNAGSTTLHLGRVCGDGVRFYADYCFRIDARKAISWSSPSEHTNGNIGDTPRRDGLGMEALAQSRPRTRRGEDLARGNPKIWKQGYTSMTAFPMFAGCEVGLIYLHQKEEQEADGAEMPWIERVVERAARGVRVAMAYAAQRDRSCQILGQLKAVNALSASASKPRLEREGLACGSIRGLTAADLSLFFRGLPRRPLIPSCFSGINLGPELDQHCLVPLVQSVRDSAQARYVSRREIDMAIGVANCSGVEVVGSLADLVDASVFLIREQIRFLAVVPLCRNRERSALLLAFRHDVDLNESERRHLELLVSTISLPLGLSGTGSAKIAAILKTVVTGWSAAAETPVDTLSAPDYRRRGADWLDRLRGGKTSLGVDG